MADVRLTATNPEDSSVVPVACDAAGRLLLEEPQVIEGPPGPPGEQGPPGQDGQDGDPFSGNFAGDVTFGGSVDLAGNITSTTYNLGSSSGQGFQLGVNGALTCQRTSAIAAVFRGFNQRTQTSGIMGDGKILVGGTLPDNPNTSLNADGSAEFVGDVNVGDYDVSNPDKAGVEQKKYGRISIQRSLAEKDSSVIQAWAGTGRTLHIYANGSAEFAGNKAGFTAEGYLWCTTRRGDTVILDATSNGLASWVEYTPTTRLEEIRDKLDANRGDTGEMHTDTP